MAMDKFPMRWKKQTAGELTVEKDRLYTWFTVRASLPEEGLWCAWAIGSEGELRLGVLEPAGDCVTIRRRFSERLVSPLGRLLGGEIRPVSGKQETWESVAEPDRLFRTPWLRKQLHRRKGILTRQSGARRLVAIPYDKDNPFPLAAMFCFAALEVIEEKKYLIFAFDDKECVVFI